MSALGLTSTWPVGKVSAAVLHSDRSVTTIGDPNHGYRLASIAKPVSAWAMLVAVEEGIISLDSPVGQPGCTLRHLLAHAGGYGFDGPDPITRPGRRRIYSNTGIELAAAAVADAAGMPFNAYLHEAVFAPLGMSASTLRGSPAHQMWSTITDLVAFAGELLIPRLISAATATEATNPVFADLAGIIPGIGRFDPCPWGLGIEIRGDKQPHWTGTRNSPATVGHFGGSGTFLWVDQVAAAGGGIACIALTDLAFDEWAAEALVLWPALSDAVLLEHVAGSG